jgi:hypothetical protein
MIVVRRIMSFGDLKSYYQEVEKKILSVGNYDSTKRTKDSQLD